MLLEFQSSEAVRRKRKMQRYQQINKWTIYFWKFFTTLKCPAFIIVLILLVIKSQIKLCILKLCKKDLIIFRTIEVNFRCFFSKEKHEYVLLAKMVNHFEWLMHRCTLHSTLLIFNFNIWIGVGDGLCWERGRRAILMCLMLITSCCQTLAWFVFYSFIKLTYTNFS